MSFNLLIEPAPLAPGGIDLAELVWQVAVGKPRGDVRRRFLRVLAW